MPNINLFFLFTLTLFSCARQLPLRYATTIQKQDSLIAINQKSTDSILSIQYLGCGGLLIQQNHNKIMIDPFFSNPSFSKVSSFSTIEADTNTIQKNYKTIDYANIDACLISHAHYDHLMDVPYISTYFHIQNLNIYGSKTVINILKSQKLDSIYLHNIEDQAAKNDTLGQWTYTNKDSTCRFMAIKYDHAPHFKKSFIKLKFFNGHYNAVPKQIKNIRDWKEGQTYAYLIDFMTKGKVNRRIYVLSGGASSAPIGFINHFEALKNKSIDVMVLCVASHDNVKNYPQKIISAHRPSFILGVHWEDFFIPYNSLDQPKAVRFTNVPKFLKKIEMLGYSNHFLIGKPLVKFKFD